MTNPLNLHTKIELFCFSSDTWTGLAQILDFDCVSFWGYAEFTISGVQHLLKQNWVFALNGQQYTRISTFY